MNWIGCLQIDLTADFGILYWDYLKNRQYCLGWDTENVGKVFDVRRITTVIHTGGGDRGG